MSSLNRRKMLEFSGCSILPFTSGCLSLINNGGNEVTFCEATIANEDIESHDVSVELVEGRDIIHSTSYELPSMEEGDMSTEEDTYVEIDGFSAGDISGGQSEGEYSFRVRIDGGDWNEIDLTEEQSDPVSVLATIQNATEVSFYVQTDVESECS